MTLIGDRILDSCAIRSTMQGSTVSIGDGVPWRTAGLKLFLGWYSRPNRKKADSLRLHIMLLLRGINHPGE